MVWRSSDDLSPFLLILHGVQTRMEAAKGLRVSVEALVMVVDSDVGSF
jgi:hypothetical protein